MKEYLCIGKIVKPQGIRGEVKVQPYTDDLARFLDLTQVWLDGRGENQTEVLSARIAGSSAYLCLKNCGDRDAAESLRGTELYVDRAHAVSLPEGRFFIVDLIGMQVVDEAGGILGKLVDISQAGGNDVYRVEGPRGFLFPALRRVMIRVEPEAGRMTLCSAALAEVAVYDDED